MHKIIKWLLLFAIFAAPMGAQAFCISTPIGELSLYRIALLVSFLLWILNNEGKINISFPKKVKKSNRFMFILFIYALFTVVWALSTSAWTRNVFFIAMALIATYLMSKNMISKGDIIEAIKAFSWGVFIQALIGWYEIFTGNYLFRDLSSKLMYKFTLASLNTPIAMQHNPNNFALIMFFGIFSSLICFLETRKKTRVVYLVFIAFEIFATFITESRSGIIAIVIAFAFLLVMSKKHKFLLLLLPFALVTIFPNINSYIQAAFSVNVSATYGSDYVRINLIKNGLNFLLDTFGFGVGAGQIDSWMASRAVYNVGSVTAIHNFWLEMLSTYGILVFTLFMAMYFRIFVTNIKAYRANSNDHLSLVLCAIMVGFIIGAVGPSSTVSLEWLWCFLAICIAGMNYMDNDYFYMIDLDSEGNK